MLLKLAMPYVDRIIQGGVIVKWHKVEGEKVGYGDDVCDVKVESKIKRSAKSRGEKIRMMKDGRSIGEEALEMVEEEVPSLVCVVRITSSDIGFVRKISAKEGSYAEVGGHLALLSTVEDEPLSSVDQAFARASEFRVVPNVIPFEEEI